MKKVIMLMSIIMLSMITFRAQAEESDQEPLMKYSDPSKPITYYGSNDTVYIPKDIQMKRQQFRGMFVYTENNIDFKQHTTVESYKSAFTEILDTMEFYHMNALIFQVRPMNDAFYKSNLNPWSEFLTGTQGESLDWDPLKWMIDETHKRNIAFHASVNAFRVSNSINVSKEEYLQTLDEKNYAALNPDYVLVTNAHSETPNQLYLNPGELEVQNFVVETIMEIVENYKVDAINLEDYFYQSMDKSQDESTYNERNMSLSDWRRENISTLVKEIKSAINHYNLTQDKHVQFGMTPKGIWESYSNDNVRGSNTIGKGSYTLNYADTRLWVTKNYLDYIAPLINSEFDHTNTKYADMVEWWSDVVKDTKVNLYIGHDLGKYNSNLNWKNPQEIPNQIRYNQKREEIKGSLLLSYSNFKEEENLPLKESLTIIQEMYWNAVALSPSLPNLIDNNPDAASRLFVKAVKGGVNLQWKGQKDVKSYLLFRFENDEKINLQDTTKIINVISQTSDRSVEFVDTTVKDNNIYKYFIIAIDHANNESMPVTYEINLSPHKYLNSELIIFSILSLITITVITVSGVKVLKK